MAPPRTVVVASAVKCDLFSAFNLLSHALPRGSFQPVAATDRKGSFCSLSENLPSLGSAWALKWSDVVGKDTCASSVVLGFVILSPISVPAPAGECLSLQTRLVAAAPRPSNEVLN